MPEAAASIVQFVLGAAVFLFGAYIAVWTLLSAVRSFILPRSQNVVLTRIVYRGVRLLFSLPLRRAQTYSARDRIMALYSPISLLGVVASWLVMTLIGFMLMHAALNGWDWYTAFKVSGSSLFTLGFALSDSFPALILEYTEAGLGMILTALLISYLPTMYGAFQRRELLVNQLEVRAGEPASPVELIIRVHRIRGLAYLGTLWEQWEIWFVDVEESHTSLVPLVFFRSPSPGRSWVTAAGVVLDSAALVLAVVDTPHNPEADLCIRAGYLALRDIASYFGIQYERFPRPDDPISISRGEFDTVCQQLEASGVPLKPDRDQAWRDYAGWRVNYDEVLIALAALTMSPYAMWVSDRSLPRWRQKHIDSLEPVP
jgi:hypothetical protein